MKKEIWIYIGGTLIAICIWWCIAFTCAYFEASAFNRATGGNVSTWDAMFIKLRVQAPVRPEPLSREEKLELHDKLHDEMRNQ